MAGRCGRCRILRSARAVVLEAALGEWKPEGALTPGKVEEVFHHLGYHLFAALVEHQDLLESTRDLAAGEREALWRAYLSRVLAWLRHHGVAWCPTTRTWSQPPRPLPPILECAMLRHREALTWLASQEP